MNRTLPLLFTALLCGLGAAYLAWYYGGGSKADPEIVVIVPKQDIPGMSRLGTKELFVQAKVKQSSLRTPEEVVKDFDVDELEKMKTKDYKLAKGVPFYKSDLVLNKNHGMAARLNEDEVAFSIRVTPEEAVAGFIDVGDRVDITCRVPSQRNEEQGKFKTVFQNIEVLGINQQAGQTPDGGPQPPQIMTLRLKRVDGPKLTMYRQLGTVQVALRKKDYNGMDTVPDAMVGEAPVGVPGAGDGIMPAPGAAASTGDPEVKPPVGSPTVPVPTVAEPAATKPEATQPPIPQPPPPPEEPKELDHTTTIVDGTRKHVDKFKLPNPKYTPKEDKDGKIEKKDPKPVGETTPAK